LASEFADQTWPADITLADDPVAAAWQLAAIAPFGPLDQVTLLRSGSLQQLLENIIEFAAGAELTLRAPWADDEEVPD
ncbi:MAG TPA: peptidase S16, partial [Rhodoglobus sp.]|nr:peptidase S16 [Rhodoglobus sp.]